MGCARGCRIVCRRGGIVGAAVASSPCYGGYSSGVDCFGNPLRGLFTGGFGGNCGCGSYSYRSYGPTTYYTEPAQPYVQPYYHHRYTHPFMRPSYRFHYRHFYRPYVRHDFTATYGTTITATERIGRMTVPTIGAGDGDRAKTRAWRYSPA